MTHAGYLVAGYSVMLGTLLLYAIRVLRRGRRLTRGMPPGERPWG